MCLRGDNVLWFTLTVPSPPPDSKFGSRLHYSFLIVSKERLEELVS
jgi:hypothetical protein